MSAPTLPAGSKLVQSASPSKEKAKASESKPWYSKMVTLEVGIAVAAAITTIGLVALYYRQGSGDQQQNSSPVMASQTLIEKMYARAVFTGNQLSQEWHPMNPHGDPGCSKAGCEEMLNQIETSHTKQQAQLSSVVSSTEAGNLPEIARFFAKREVEVGPGCQKEIQTARNVCHDSQSSDFDCQRHVRIAQNVCEQVSTLQAFDFADSFCSRIPSNEGTLSKETAQVQAYFRKIQGVCDQVSPWAKGTYRDY